MHATIEATDGAGTPLEDAVTSRRARAGPAHRTIRSRRRVHSWRGTRRRRRAGHSEDTSESWPSGPRIGSRIACVGLILNWTPSAAMTKWWTVSASVRSRVSDDPDASDHFVSATKTPSQPSGGGSASIFRQRSRYTPVGPSSGYSAARRSKRTVAWAHAFAR